MNAAVSTDQPMRKRSMLCSSTSQHLRRLTLPGWSPRALWTLGLVVALLGAPGCGGGPKLYPVAGEVRFQGEPVAKGSIRFIPADLQTRTDGARIEQGRYNIQLHPGRHRVEIRAIRDHPTKREPSLTPGETLPVEVSYLPAKYNTESVLTTTIDGPRDDLDFLLTE